jgi:hypothetical protein
MTEKTDKEKWLELWNLSGEEGERQWQLKQEMHARPPKVNYVIPDIQAYKSMATGEYIRSRSAHREHLKQHGLVELGNERIKPPEHKPDPTIKRDIINAVNSVMG